MQDVDARPPHSYGETVRRSAKAVAVFAMGGSITLLAESFLPLEGFGVVSGVVFLFFAAIWSALSWREIAEWWWLRRQHPNTYPMNVVSKNALDVVIGEHPTGGTMEVHLRPGDRGTPPFRAGDRVLVTGKCPTKKRYSLNLKLVDCIIRLPTERHHRMYWPEGGDCWPEFWPR